MYNRRNYIDKLKQWENKPLIKIITGIRRAGKSTLIRLFIEHLKNSGINESQILYINKESLEFEAIQNYKQLYDYVKTRFTELNKKLYLFVDEVQYIESWEKAAVSLFSENVADIYLSGSNSQLLSSEFAALLSGRYIEIKVFPLTFSEFLIFRNKNSVSDNDFNDFLKFGGMPGIHQIIWEQPIIFEYLSSVFDTIILKDVVKRYGIRNVAFLEKVILFLFDNIAQIFSAKRVVDFLKNENRRTNIETVYNYIKYLEETFIIYRIPRYDIKGKRFLEVREKYFLTDIGLRHAIIGYRKNDINQLLENILFIELKKRGYKIYIGQVDGAEIDMIVERNGRKAYLQVAYLLASETTIEREFGSLMAIKDNYPKYVLSMDKFFEKDYQGIIHLNIIDFLLNEEYQL